MLEALAAFGASFVAVATLALALWPRFPRAAALAWLALTPLFLASFWNAPGPLPAFLGLVVFFWSLRALDAARNRSEPGRLAYLRWVVDLSLQPPREQRPPGRPLPRVVRGLAFAAVGVIVSILGMTLEPWRVSSYLDDLALLFIVAPVVFTAFADLLIATLWARGQPVPDLHDLDFVRARTLRAFWTSWNGAVSRVLSRAFGIRRRPALSVILAFLASGVLHAVPLLVAVPDRREGLLLAGAALAFFLIHGLGVLVEGTRVRRWLPPRVILFLVLFVTAPLYPVAFAVALGFHRPVHALTWWPLVEARSHGR